MSPSEEMVCFYMELGLASTQWAHVERALLEVLSICTKKSEDFNLIGHGFFAIENFRSKLEFVNVMLRETINDESQLVSWRKLWDWATKASQQRNQLVHRRVMIYTVEKPGHRYSLIKWRSNSTANKKTARPTNAISVRDIIKIRHDFVSLVVALENFSARHHMPTHVKEDSAQHPNLPTIQTLVTQIHSILGHPRVPSRRKS